MRDRLEAILAIALLSIFAVFAYTAHTYFFEMDLLIAWRGFSVVDFANSVLYPENFALDYPGGAAFIGNSALVWIYPFFADLLDVTPYSILLCVIAVEVVAIVVAVFLLLRTLLPSTPIASYVLLSVLFLGSAARQIDLANFASIFLVGQFYVFADVLRIAALSMFLTRRYTVCAILLCVGFTIHPTMTALTLPVLFAFLLAAGRELRQPKPWLAAGAVLAFGAVWFTLFISQSSLGAEQITGEEYFEHSRLFNYHWYLSDLQRVLVYPDRVLLPFMALVLAGLEAVRRTNSISSQLKAQIFAAIAMVCAISLFGLVASHNHWSEALVKAAPQRISSFVGILLVPFLVHRLLRDISAGHYGFALLGAAFLGSAVLQRYPYAIALAAIYALPALGEVLRTRRLRSIEGMVVLAAMPPLALLAAHWAAGFQLPLSGYLGTGWLFEIALAGLAIAALQGVFPKLRAALPASLSSAARLSIAALFAFACYQSLTVRYTHSEARRALYSDYKEVQLWARDTTEPTALFMTDPCISYGWRDFSQRSTWGSIQEFLKTGWLYTSNLADFEEGLARAKRIGIDSRSMLAENPKSIRHNFWPVCGIARDVYYAQDPTWMNDMIDDYGIDYFVYIKEQSKNGPAHQPVFENKSFFVVKSTTLPRS